jgi:uncharacterized protein YdeI (YjbR/CyaY-like superfamily)
MSQSDPRIDAYIAKSAKFAKPILVHIRKIVHEVCPEVVETIKWSLPHFDYKNEMMCGMAAFKEHAAFGFWKWQLMSASKEYAKTEEAMGAFGRITKIADLPSADLLKKYVKEAMALNDAGIKVPRPAKKERAELVVPEVLIEALERNEAARDTFEGFSYSNKKEYVEWITGAKTEATRQKRLAQALEWMAEGKSRNWKYMNC